MNQNKFNFQNEIPVKPSSLKMPTASATDRITEKRNSSAIKTIGLVSALVAIPLILIGVSRTVQFPIQIQEQVDPVPTEIVVSNLGTDTATISFQTGGDGIAPSILYGTKGEDLTNESFFDERTIDGSETFNLHYHKINNLQPNTEYEFQLRIGNTLYPNESLSFNNTFTTFTNSESNPDIISGIISAEDLSNAVIYAHFTDGQSNSTSSSALINISGEFEINLNNSKQPDGDDFTNPTDLIIFASIAKVGKGRLILEPDVTTIPSINLDPAVGEYDPEEIVTNGGGTPAPTNTPVSSPTPEPTNGEIEPTATPTAAPTQANEVPLAFSNVNDGEKILSGSVITGTGPSDEVIEIRINNSLVKETTINSNNSWQYQLNHDLSEGVYNLSVTSDSDSIEISFEITSLDNLPTTNIENTLRIGIPAIIFVTGIYLAYLTWKGRREKSERLF